MCCVNIVDFLPPPESLQSLYYMLQLSFSSSCLFADYKLTLNVHIATTAL